MKPSQFKLASLASAMVLMCAAGSAQAGAYALSANNIQNFTVTPSNGSVTFATPTDTSGASANLNGVTVGGPGVAGVSDAPVASLGNPVVTNNSRFGAGLAITPVGPTATNYSYADAQIAQTAIPGVFNASTVAESHLETGGTAGATSTNSSATAITVDFTIVGGPATIAFNFLADPVIRTFLQPITGLFAQGVLQATLTIECRSVECGGVGLEVFSWSPNGSVGGAAGVGGSIGGNETADAENLNRTVSNFQPGGPVNFSDAAGLGAYAAITNALLEGTYSLSLAMTSTDTVRKAVPEPGTIGLLGLGLAALGYTSRRRRV